LGLYGKAVFLMVELGFFVFLINYFLYASAFTVGGWISNVYLYLLRCCSLPSTWGCGLLVPPREPTAGLLAFIPAGGHT
jgi:hypothetical protein